MKKTTLLMPIIMLLGKWSGIGITDGRGKFGGTVASRSRAGATFRNKVTPVNRRSAAQSRVRAFFGNNSQEWRLLTNAQRSAWRALADTGVTVTNIFGDAVRLAGNALFIRCNSNLQISNNGTITDAPDINQTAAGLISLQPSSDVSATELFATCVFSSGLNTVPVNNSLVVYATPKLSAGVSYVRSQLRILDVFLPAQDTSAQNLWTLYEATYGAPEVGDNIVFACQVVNNLSGFAGTPIQTVVNIRA
jgi:hypothetical protein